MHGHVPAVSLITLALTLCVLMMVQMAAESAVVCLVLAFFFWYTFAVKRLGACAEGGAAIHAGTSVVAPCQGESWCTRNAYSMRRLMVPLALASGASFQYKHTCMLALTCGLSAGLAYNTPVAWEHGCCIRATHLLLASPLPCRAGRGRH